MVFGEQLQLHLCVSCGRDDERLKWPNIIITMLTNIIITMTLRRWWWWYCEWRTLPLPLPLPLPWSLLFSLAVGLSCLSSAFASGLRFLALKIILCTACAVNLATTTPYPPHTLTVPFNPASVHSPLPFLLSLYLYLLLSSLRELILIFISRLPLRALGVLFVAWHKALRFATSSLSSCHALLHSRRQRPF